MCEFSRNYGHTHTLDMKEKKAGLLYVVRITSYCVGICDAQYIIAGRLVRYSFFSFFVLHFSSTISLLLFHCLLCLFSFVFFCFVVKCHTQSLWCWWDCLLFVLYSVTWITIENVMLFRKILFTHWLLTYIHSHLTHIHIHVFDYNHCRFNFRLVITNSTANWRTRANEKTIR